MTRCLVLALGMAFLFTGSSAAHQDEFLENGAGKFKVEITGAPVASANVESIEVEDLVIDQREVTTGAEWDYRAYQPGQPHYGNIVFSVRVTPGLPSELFEWWESCQAGKNIRKNISVIIKKRDGSDARTYNYLDTFPLAYTPDDPNTPELIESMVVVPTGFSCDAALPDAPVLDEHGVLNGFAVEIGASSGGVPGGVDASWEFAQGGAITKEKKSLPFVDPNDPTQARLRGARSVHEVQLRGPMTPSRKALCTWINETVQGGPDWRRTVAVQEIKANGKKGKTFTYLDCFPTRYVFPGLSAAGTGNLYEEVTMKPIRLELK